MTIMNSFNDSDVVIKPARGKRDPLISPDAIMVTIPSELDHMVEMSRAERLTQGTSHPFNLFIAKGDQDMPLALAGPVLGAPQGVIIMEKLIALGAKRIWLLGWCGSLQSHLLIGDFIIPTTALAEEAMADERKRRKGAGATQVAGLTATQATTSKPTVLG